MRRNCNIFGGVHQSAEDDEALALPIFPLCKRTGEQVLGEVRGRL